MGPPIRTSTDEGAARASARDAWVTTTRHYFIDACAAWRRDPEHALGRVRLVVEGFVHIVCVELEPTFAPHERGELRRAPLEKAIPIARRHLPPNRRDLVETLKNLGNNFHHNQGVVQRSTPNMARAALFQCSELLTWLDGELLRTALPPDYAQALRDLEGASPVATPLPSAIATPVATPLPPTAAPSKPSGAPRAPWRLVAAISLGALVVVIATLFFVLVSGRAPAPAASVSPELAWVGAYNDAIASRDVDRILAVHALPTPRYFMAKNQSASQLRALYEGWYRSLGKTRETGFRDCKPAGTAPDGSRAVRCDTYVDPPLDKGLSVIPTCLVFRADGRLISRTEIRSFPTCPPPPL